MANKTYYEILQVTPTACAAVIRGAYRALSQQHHPDKNINDASVLDTTMKDINEAYRVLSNPVRRKEYDRKLKRLSADLVKSSQQKQHHATTSNQTKSLNQILWAQMMSIFWLGLLGISGYWLYVKMVWGPAHSYLVAEPPAENCVYKVNMDETEKQQCEQRAKK